jgi:hypothetical protein
LSESFFDFEMPLLEYVDGGFKSQDQKIGEEEEEEDKENQAPVRRVDSDPKAPLQKEEDHDGDCQKKGNRKRHPPQVET